MKRNPYKEWVKAHENTTPLEAKMEIIRLSRLVARKDRETLKAYFARLAE